MEQIRDFLRSASKCNEIGSEKVTDLSYLRDLYHFGAFVPFGTNLTHFEQKSDPLEYCGWKTVAVQSSRHQTVVHIHLLPGGHKTDIQNIYMEYPVIGRESSRSTQTKDSLYKQAVITDRQILHVPTDVRFGLNLDQLAKKGLFLSV